MKKQMVVIPILMQSLQERGHMESFLLRPRYMVDLQVCLLGSKEP